MFIISLVLKNPPFFPEQNNFTHQTVTDQEGLDSLIKSHKVVFVKFFQVCLFVLCICWQEIVLKSISTTLMRCESGFTPVRKRSTNYRNISKYIELYRTFSHRKEALLIDLMAWLKGEAQRANSRSLFLSLKLSAAWSVSPYTSGKWPDEVVWY